MTKPLASAANSLDDAPGARPSAAASGGTLIVRSPLARDSAKDGGPPQAGSADARFAGTAAGRSPPARSRPAHKTDCIPSQFSKYGRRVLVFEKLRLPRLLVKRGIASRNLSIKWAFKRVFTSHLKIYIDTEGMFTEI
jgi:hypothetical protein